MSNSSMLKYLVVCLVLIYSVQSRTSPLGKEKEGFCLPTLGAGICVERCKNDQSCPGRQKCCSNGCGHVCMHPTGGIEPSPAMCPKGKPLPNVFCGRGPSRQDCPQGYSCNIHPSDGFAVCCPDDNRATPVCGPVCAIFCKFGNVLDNKGCPTCNCRTGCKNEAKPLASVRCGSGGQKCPGRYECSSPPSGGAGVCCGRSYKG